MRTRGGRNEGTRRENRTLSTYRAINIHDLYTISLYVSSISCHHTHVSISSPPSLSLSLALSLSCVLTSRWWGFCIVCVISHPYTNRTGLCQHMNMSYIILRVPVYTSRYTRSYAQTKRVRERERERERKRSSWSPNDSLGARGYKPQRTKRIPKARYAKCAFRRKRERYYLSRFCTRAWYSIVTEKRNAKLRRTNAGATNLHTYDVTRPDSNISGATMEIKSWIAGGVGEEQREIDKKEGSEKERERARIETGIALRCRTMTKFTISTLTLDYTVYSIAHIHFRLWCIKL